jgi:hypothetical protein
VPTAARRHRRCLPVQAGPWTSLDSGEVDDYLLQMANPLDRDIESVLRKGREPESWKRPSPKRENLLDQRNVTGQGPAGESGKPPAGTGMNRPGHPR